MHAGDKGLVDENAAEKEVIMDEELQRAISILVDAKDTLEREGEVEIDMPRPDEDPKDLISEGDDNGCYVRAWVWFDFSGTDRDKENEHDD